MNAVRWECVLMMFVAGATVATGDDFALQARRQREVTPGSRKFTRVEEPQRWSARSTAVIVCDVWDYHHCLNAVRRLDEFAPRLNQVLAEARRRGAVIIHSPSDCMEAYASHPARKRAQAAPVAAKLPADIQHWCSQIPREEVAAYPIDQSDGGEDDDPAEHRAWAEKLKQLGRNPGMPWKRQSDHITIDEQLDYISDRGDEVWNILAARGIEHVILTGVHVNMCVLGRPFGLRQLARNGKDVVLMRDMTDAMYNPKRWPYVDHYTGNDLVISHIERFVCPTVTSDQILGGQPFQFSLDRRERKDVTDVPTVAAGQAAQADRRWATLRIPSPWKSLEPVPRDSYEGPAWYRCAIRMPSAWLGQDNSELRINAPAGSVKAWCNGMPLTTTESSGMAVVAWPRSAWTMDDINLLVVRIEHPRGEVGLAAAPTLHALEGAKTFSLAGRWQYQLGDSPEWSNIPLPAKFGLGPDCYFEPK